MDNHWQPQYISVNNIAGKVLTTHENPGSENPVGSLTCLLLQHINVSANKKEVLRFNVHTIQNKFYLPNLKDQLGIYGDSFF